MPDVVITEAGIEDLPEILALQKSAYLSEAELCRDFTIQPLQQTMDDIIREFSSGLFLKAEQEGRIVGSVRASEDGETCYIGKLIVDPELQNKGIGTLLLESIENTFFHLNRYELYTGHKSQRNIHFYRKRGYSELMKKPVSEKLTLVYLEKNTPGENKSTFRKGRKTG